MRRLVAALLLVSGAAATADAHHTTATSRVGPASIAAGSGFDLGVPRLELGLAYQLHSFNRVLDGETTFESADYGRATVHLAVIAASVVLARGTRFELALPAGAVDIRTPNNGTATTFGLSDVQLGIAQDLVALASKKPSAVSVTLRAGIQLPTGQYASERALSVTDLRPGPAGQLNLSTFNTNASLGRGAWAMNLGAEMNWRVNARFRTTVALTVATPINRTTDGALWGADVTASLTSCGDIAPGRLGLCAGAAYRHHGRDTLDDIDEVSGTDARRAVGGRDEVRVTAGVDGWIGRNVACMVGVDVPVWQRVGGVQLVEDLAFRAGCTVATPL